MTKTVNARQITTPGPRRQNSAQIVHEPEKYQRITGAEMCKISRLQRGHATKRSAKGEGKHTERAASTAARKTEGNYIKNAMNQPHKTRRWWIRFVLISCGEAAGCWSQLTVVTVPTTAWVQEGVWNCSCWTAVWKIDMGNVACYGEEESVCCTLSADLNRVLSECRLTAELHKPHPDLGTQKKGVTKVRS